MDAKAASSARNFVIVFTLIAFLGFGFLVLWFAGDLQVETAETNIKKLQETIAISFVEPFLQSDYATLISSTNQLISKGEDLGIAYLGMMNDRGIMFSRGVSRLLPDQTHAKIRDERLQNRAESLIYFESEELTFEDEDGNLYPVRELVLPVSFRNEQAGAIKLGLVPESFQSGWGQFRTRILAGVVIIILISILLAVMVSQRWRQQINNSITQTKNKVQNRYEEKLKSLQKKIDAQPLTTDEFFQIIDFGKKINDSLDPADVLRYLVSSVAKILSVKQVVVFLISPRDPDVLCGQMGMKDGEWMDRRRLQNIEIKIGSGEVGTIAELGQVNILDKPRPGAGVAAAVRAEGQTIGVIRATEKKTGARMGNKDKLQMRLISQLAGNTVKNAFAFQELK
jgi:hypothetical protein